MSDTDSSLLIEIIDAVDRSYVYYYDDNDRNNKLKNIIRMLGKEKTAQYMKVKKVVLASKNDLMKNARKKAY